MHVTRTGGGVVHTGFWQWELEKKIPFGRRKRKLQDNIRMNLEDVGWQVEDWIDLSQDRDQWRTLLNTIMNLREYLTS